MHHWHKVLTNRRVRPIGVAAIVVATTLSALYAGLWGVHAQSAPFPAYFTANITATVAMTNITPLESVLLARIAAATTSIDLAIYDFSRVSVRDALLAAHDRGVTVRVVGDNEARADEDSKPNFDALEAAGIPIVVDGVVPTSTTTVADGVAEMRSAALDGNPGALPAEVLRSAIMHDKYFIIDKRWVWTGSINISDSDMTLNHNNALDIESPALAALYQIDFDQMFGGLFGTLKTPLITHTITISDTPVSVYFGPQDNPITQIIAAVNRAQRSVDFAIFTFTDDALADALIAARVRGVSVRGLWDSLAAGNAASDDERICAAGVAVKIENTRGLMHNKMLIIDAEGTAPTVVTGSLNWTATGNQANNENTLVIENGPLTLQYAAEFQKMWDAIDVFPCTAVRLPIIRNGAEPPTPTPLTPEPTQVVTPTTTPTATPTGTTVSTVRLSRIVYDVPGPDLAGEFAEVVNGGPGATTLTGWTLRDLAANVFTFPPFELAPGAAVKVWVKTGVDSAEDLFWNRGTAVWNNDGDIATLSDSTGVLISECAYAQGSGEAICP